MTTPTFRLTIVDTRSRTPAESHKRFLKLARLTIPTQGFQVVEAKPVVAPTSNERSPQQLDMEVDGITDPHGNTEGGIR